MTTLIFYFLLLLSLLTCAKNIGSYEYYDSPKRMEEASKSTLLHLMYNGDSNQKQILRQEMCSNANSKHSLFNIQCSTSEHAEKADALITKLSTRKSDIPEVTLTPIVLVPGLGGSRLDAKWSNVEKPAWYCMKNSNWLDGYWLLIRELLVEKCWMHNLAIVYDEATDTYADAKGVQTRPNDFGGVNGINYLDKELSQDESQTDYFGTMIKVFESVGYTVGHNLAGMPYDWRLPTIQWLGKDGWASQFKSVIEGLYNKNGNAPVAVVSHSMGGPTMTYFFNSMDSAWKSKYIKMFLPVSAPFSGAPKSLRAVVSGDDFGIELFGKSLMNLQDVSKLARQAGGIMELIPAWNSWPGQPLLITTPNAQYTVSNISDIFKTMGLSTTAAAYNGVKNFLGELKAPEVEMHCIYGIGTETEISYVFDNDKMSGQPSKIIFGDGDGTVPISSLRDCQRWGTLQSQKVTISEFQDLVHAGLLLETSVIEYILEKVNG